MRACVLCARVCVVCVFEGAAKGEGEGEPPPNTPACACAQAGSGTLSRLGPAAHYSTIVHRLNCESKAGCLARQRGVLAGFFVSSVEGPVRLVLFLSFPFTVPAIRSIARGTQRLNCSMRGPMSFGSIACDTQRLNCSVRGCLY